MKFNTSYNRTVFSGLGEIGKWVKVLTIKAQGYNIKFLDHIKARCNRSICNCSPPTEN